ncbi:hypothetical protein Tco_0308823 [Tanacetum coccineum]
MPIDMLGFFGWLASKRQGMIEPVKVKCIFLGYRKGVVGNRALEMGNDYILAMQGLRSGLPRSLLLKAKGNVYGNMRSSEVLLGIGTFSILSLEGSLSGDCDVEKIVMWMLDKFIDDCRQTYSSCRILTTHAAYMTLTEAANEAIWLKGLAIESGFELKIVAGIATGLLSKAIPGPRFQYRSKLLRIGID